MASFVGVTIKDKQHDVPVNPGIVSPNSSFTETARGEKNGVPVGGRFSSREREQSDYFNTFFRRGGGASLDF